MFKDEIFLEHYLIRIQPVRFSVPRSLYLLKFTIDKSLKP